MRRLFIAVAVTFGVGMAASVSSTPNLPEDVRAFSDKRDGCDHFRGEPWDLGAEPEVKERREYILSKVREFCTGTDRRLAALRKKYRGNETVRQHLGQYDTHIERR